MKVHMYLQAKNEVNRSRLSKVTTQTERTYRQTDATERIITPYSQTVIIHIASYSDKDAGMQVTQCIVKQTRIEESTQ